MENQKNYDLTDIYLCFSKFSACLCYVRGNVKSLGTDCIEKEMRDEHQKELKQLLKKETLVFSVVAYRSTQSELH